MLAMSNVTTPAPLASTLPETMRTERSAGPEYCGAVYAGEETFVVVFAGSRLRRRDDGDRRISLHLRAALAGDEHDGNGVGRRRGLPKGAASASDELFALPTVYALPQGMEAIEEVAPFVSKESPFWHWYKNA